MVTVVEDAIEQNHYLSSSCTKAFTETIAHFCQCLRPDKDERHNSKRITFLIEMRHVIVL